ncbi:hypothetical protein [Actinospica robiniae]|uniref:hypothetical protein n=1 Tax=Actinospica robiniae TaxID=304901 RepID=UPI0003F94875|nr:hypothetical protein [Actinospica robiniae]
MIILRAVRRSIGYEVTRLATRRSTIGVAGLAMFGSALVTLPAARAAVTWGAPQSRVDWVVSGGSLGAIVPAAAGVAAAAWLGAGLVTEDYRFGLGLSTYSRLPRRGAGLLGKIVVAAGLGLLLAIVTRVAAFFTALGGFALAHSTEVSGTVSPSFFLLLPTVSEAFFAMLAGVVGVLTAPLLRVRLGAVAAACGVVAMLATVSPHTQSPYAPLASRLLLLSGLPILPTVILLPEFALFGLTCAALLAVRRRRVD